MTNRLGMDAGRVRGYADQMDGVADALGSVLASVNASVGQLSSVWLGADAHELAQRWQYHDREAVALLATHVRDLARIARTNAAEQDRASGVGGSVGAAGSAFGALSVIEGLRRYADPFENALSDVTEVLGTPDTIGKLAAGLSVGAASSSLLSKVHIPSWASGKLAETAGRSVKVLGVVGAATTVATKSLDAVSDFSRGSTADGVRDVADGTSAGLKATGTPWGYVGGVALSEASDISAMAEQVDWSIPPPMPTPTNLVTLYAPAFGQAVVDLPSHVWKWLS